MLEETKQHIRETVAYLNKRMTIHPKVAIVLGSGLGGLTKALDVVDEIPYGEIPFFPVSTVKGHKGTLIFGRLNNVEVVVLNGRFHYYEGYPMEVVTYPQQVFCGIGVKTIILSNAAGGMNPTFKVGDIMLIRDHINFFGTNPLLGPNDDELGPRFPNMNEVYSKRLIKLAHQKAAANGIHLQEGVYMGVSGPCFETPAEYKAYWILGADAVGMSTVPEAIVAHHRGMEIFALSVITDLGVVGQVAETSHEEVLAAANTAGPKMVKVICEMLPEI
ncbi:MAG: purine-nucleoside phosphorylase [Bacteroidales bacterium]|jgi:purine-nucleoside phosphorylase|nr:purine-nucleoside phosphorylase [Bacteroidales bacterium]